MYRDIPLDHTYKKAGNTRDTNEIIFNRRWVNKPVEADQIGTIITIAFKYIVLHVHSYFPNDK